MLVQDTQKQGAGFKRPRMWEPTSAPAASQQQPALDTRNSGTSQAMADLALGSGSFGGPNGLQMMSHPPGLQQGEPANCNFNMQF